MFPDSGNSGDLGDGRAGGTAANSSTQQPDWLSSYYCDNYTEHMEQIMDEWEKRGFSPDGIYTGFLADEEQLIRSWIFSEGSGKRRPWCWWIRLWETMAVLMGFIQKACGNGWFSW